MSEPITREAFSETSSDLARPVCLADLVEELVADAEELLKAAAENRPVGPTTGIPRLDHALDHSLAPGVHSFTGDPGSGKTGLAQQIAARCQFPAIYVSAEQSLKVLFLRHIARETRTPFSDVKRAVPAAIRKLSQEAAAASPMLMMLDATRKPAPPYQILGLARSLAKRFGSRQVLIVIDALQPWAKGLNDGPEYEQTQAGIAALVEVAAELQSPLIALSHRNRLSARDKNPTGLTAAKGSADIEHLAETALHLSPDDKDFDPKSDEPRKISCHVSKNRHGPSGFYLPLFYQGKTHTFTDRPGGPWW